MEDSKELKVCVHNFDEIAKPDYQNQQKIIVSED